MRLEGAQDTGGPQTQTLTQTLTHGPGRPPWTRTACPTWRAAACGLHPPPRAIRSFNSPFLERDPARFESSITGVYHLDAVRAKKDVNAPSIAYDGGVLELFTSRDRHLSSKAYYSAIATALRTSQVPEDVQAAQNKLKLVQRTTELRGLLAYLVTYFSVEDKLSSYYGSRSRAKANTWAYMKKRSCLDQLPMMLGNADPRTVVIVGGGYMGKRATKGCSRTPVMQKLLRAVAAQKRLVIPDEYLSSKMCSIHECRMEPTSSRGFTCKQCGFEVNRDTNASDNVHKVFLQHVKDGTRPAYLRRPKPWSRASSGAGAGAGGSTPAAGAGTTGPAEAGGPQRRKAAKQPAKAPAKAAKAPAKAPARPAPR